MSFLSLEQTLGKFKNLEGEDSALPKTVKYGLSFKIKFEAESVGKTYGKRNAALFSNLATMVGKVNCEIIPDVPLFDGVNNQIIDPDTGFPVENLITKVLNTSWDKETKTNINRVKMFMNSPYDNAVSALYNMLRLMYIKKYEEIHGNTPITQQDIVYDDGHVRMNMQQVFNMHDDWSFDDTMWPVMVNIRTIATDHNNIMDGQAEGPVDMAHSHFIINTSGLTTKDIIVIRTALSEFDFDDAPLRLFHNSPRLNDNLWIQMTGSRNVSRNTSLTIGDLSYSDIGMAIRRLVTTHRLQADFDIAYAMVAQVLYGHVPRSAESMIWWSKSNTMKLPYSGLIRGGITAMLGGAPYVTDVTRWQTFKSWLSQPHRIIFHSIGMSEAVTVSTFDYVTRRRWTPEDRNDFDEIDGLDKIIGNTLASECGLLKDLLFINMRTQQAVNAPYETRIGLHRYDWLYDIIDPKFMAVTVLDRDAITAYDLRIRRRAGERSEIYIPLTRVTPCVYPVLTMGINKSDFYLNFEELDFEIEYNKKSKTLFTYEATQAYRLMSFLRIAGWDCQVRRHNAADVHSNWSANHNGHFIPTFLPDHQGFEMYHFDTNHFIKRHNSWIDMPTIGSKLKCKMTMEYRTVRRYFDGVEVMSPLLPFTIDPVDISKQDKTLDKMAGLLTQIVIKDIEPISDYALDFIHIDYATIDVALQALGNQVNYTLRQDHGIWVPQ
nr:MAG: putative coat protein [Totiviridae sp.]